MALDFKHRKLIFKTGEDSGVYCETVVLKSPKSAHRHRKGDLLAISFCIWDEHRYDRSEIDLLTNQSAGIFFQSQGSVTRAMQAMIDWINGEILERNIDLGYDGIQARGSINAAVLHKDWLFIGQYGKSSTILATDHQFNSFGQDEGEGESLGQSKRIQARFYQAKATEGNLLLMTKELPEYWNPYQFSGIVKLAKSQLKRKLLNQVNSNLDALVLHIKEGVGEVIADSWEEPVFDKPAERIPAESDSSKPVITKENPKDAGEVEESLEEAAPGSTSNSEDATNVIDENESPEKDFSDAIPIKPGQTTYPTPEIAESDVSNADFEEEPPKWLVWIARRWMGLKTLSAKLRHRTSGLSQKIQAINGSSQGNSPVFLVLLAIAIPLVVVLSAWIMYLRTGKQQQFENFLEQAQETAGQARQADDLMTEYVLWSKTFDLVQSAENYGTSTASRDLFTQSQFRLDEMDLASRLEFRPALTDFLPEGVVIQRIQSATSGTYLLDQTTGSILRTFLNSKGFYEVDEAFQCAPGPYGLVTVSKLIDFVTLPANDDNYKVMAVDSQGNLLYCRPGELPDSRTLSIPPGGWGNLSGAAFEEDILYILDAGTQHVWLYAGRDPDRIAEDASGIVFSESPVSFFDDEIPDISGAVDLVVNREDFYILHADGHMSQCRYSFNKDLRLTTCEDPAPYTDNRVGRETKNPWIFMDANFFIMEKVSIPNPALLILDKDHTMFYQFSLQLNLEQTLKVQPDRNFPIPDAQPSGFGLTADMDVFLAFDNQLFIAALR
jgi:hypothetical protein